MGNKIEKAKKRLKSLPTDYRYSEAKNLLISLGYYEYNKGKTSGSRVLFIKKADAHKIMLHKPHPKDEMPLYAVRQLVENLENRGEL